MEQRMTRFLRVLMAALALGASALALAEPTLDQVYAATRTGHLAEAQAMMQDVLKQHPNSAKAHYVDAEVLARSGNFDAARSELAMAEKLEPGLAFASPTAVQSLRQELSGRPGALPVQAAAGSSTPWGMIIIIGGLALLLVVWLVRRQAAQNPVVYAQQPGGGYYPMGSAGPMGTPMAPMGGGSGLMGSLATGAALGAGMVAGEALAHRLMGDGERAVPPASYVNDPSAGLANQDMGGQDFGISDAGSWDSGGDSGSDWS
jgi:hypothetical protein